MPVLLSGSVAQVATLKNQGTVRGVTGARGITAKLDAVSHSISIVMDRSKSELVGPQLWGLLRGEMEPSQASKPASPAPHRAGAHAAPWRETYGDLVLQAL